MSMKAQSGMSLRKAAQSLKIGRVVLYGILIGMGMVPRVGARGDRGTKPKLLTADQVSLIRRHLTAYRARKGG